MTADVEQSRHILISKGDERVAAEPLTGTVVMRADASMGFPSTIGEQWRP
jgi:hypothetical protein